MQETAWMRVIKWRKIVDEVVIADDETGSGGGENKAMKAHILVQKRKHHIFMSASYQVI